MGVIPTVGPRWALYTEGEKYLENGAQTLLHPEEPKDAVLPHTDTLLTLPKQVQAVTSSRC